MHAPVLLAFALAALPASKLGPHVVNPLQGGAGTVLAACPRLAVFAAPDAVGAIASFRSSCPLAQVVVSGPPGSLRFPRSVDAAAAADQAWNAFNGNLAGVDPAHVHWLEVVAEPGVVIPDWRVDDVAATWAAAFFSRLADRIRTAGYAPLVGSIPAGAGATAFRTIAQALEDKTYPWGWSYQAFSSALSSADDDPALGFRAVRTAAGLAGRSIVLSRGGRAAPGWRSAGTSAEAYLAWMKAIDARLQEDRDVVGLALYQFGDTASGFSLADLASDLAAHIESASFASDAGLPSGCDGGCGPTPDVGRPTSGTTTTGSSTAVEETSGCSSAGAAALPALALLLLGLRRRR